MKLYLLSKRGVYCQGHVGIFPSIAQAREEAEKALNREHDSYHDFRLEEFILDEVVPFTYFGEGCDPDYTPKLVEVYRKGKE